MIRVAIFIVLSFLAPFLIHGLWKYSVCHLMKRAQSQKPYPWFGLLSAGALLTLLMLIQMQVFSGAPPRESSYQPPQLGKDGVVTPGMFNPSP